MNDQPHPLYPERHVKTITVRGVDMPGLFTGPAAIWTGGSSPRVIGPFEDVLAAQQYMTRNATASNGQIFPIDPPEEQR
jgi:hypothetical protein